MNMEEPFVPQGKQSIAGYVKAIKENPDRRGNAFLAEIMGVGYLIAEKATLELKAQNLIRNDAMGTKQPKWVVTTLGHRYLESHKEDLEEVFAAPMPQVTAASKRIFEEMESNEDRVLDALTPKDGIKGYGVPHDVPRAPEGPVLPAGWIPSKPKAVKAPVMNTPKEVRTILPPATPAPVSPGARVIQLPADADDLPEMNEEDFKKRPIAPIPKRNHGDFKKQVRSVVSDMLIDRFADQLTAKDVLDELDKTADDVEEDVPW